MSRLVFLCLLAAASLSSVGCNTIEGLGQDLRRAGEKIEDAAKKK